MGDHLRVSILFLYVVKPTRATQPCIDTGSLNRAPAIIGWGIGRNITSARRLAMLCDSILHMSSRSCEACLWTAILYLLTYFTLHKTSWSTHHTSSVQTSANTPPGEYCNSKLDIKIVHKKIFKDSMTDPNHHHVCFQKFGPKIHPNFLNDAANRNTVRTQRITVRVMSKMTRSTWPMKLRGQ